MSIHKDARCFMRALTIHQPWPWAIFHSKDVENRSQSTRHRGPLLVHASKTVMQFDHACYLLCDVLAPADLIELASEKRTPQTCHAALLGIVDVVDCVQDHPSPWAMPHSWHWVLANPRPFPVAIPWRGYQGLWNVEPDALKAKLENMVKAGQDQAEIGEVERMVQDALRGV